MNIAVASDDKVHVSGHIGRCKSFIVFKTDKEKILNKEIRENVFTNHHRGHQHHPVKAKEEEETATID